MKKENSFEIFLYNRLRIMLSSINDKYNTNLEIIDQQFSEYYNFSFDGMILLNSKPLIYVEFRYRIQERLRERYRSMESIHPILIFSQTQFSIIENEKEVTYNIDKFTSEILKIVRRKICVFLDEIQLNIANKLKEEIRQRFKLSIEFSIENIYFDYDNLTFRFSEKYTNQFFNSLLPNQKEYVCRYTSQDSIYQTINNEKQRMFGIAGMNDTEEINYTEKYLYEGRFTPPSFSNYNERFILSCSSMEVFDNLTMYRLYANDAKGVCLKYKINSDNSNQNFYIKKVEYADSKGVNHTLESLKKIIEIIEKSTGHIFDFFGDSGWKYFFKPKEYAIENEVRLLYDRFGAGSSALDSKWVITYGNGILNPYIDFSLKTADTPPIILKEIWLGPKHPEKLINQKQYEDFIRIRENNIGTISVKESKIKNYR